MCPNLELIEGKPACRLGDKMLMNHGNTACVSGCDNDKVPHLDSPMRYVSYRPFPLVPSPCEAPKRCIVDNITVRCGHSDRNLALNWAIAPLKKVQLIADPDETIDLTFDKSCGVTQGNPHCGRLKVTQIYLSNAHDIIGQARLPAFDEVTLDSNRSGIALKAPVIEWDDRNWGLREWWWLAKRVLWLAGTVNAMATWSGYFFKVDVGVGVSVVSESLEAGKMARLKFTLGRKCSLSFNGMAIYYVKFGKMAAGEVENCVWEDENGDKDESQKNEMFAHCATVREMKQVCTFLEQFSIPVDSSFWRGR